MIILFLLKHRKKKQIYITPHRYNKIAHQSPARSSDIKLNITEYRQNVCIIRIIIWASGLGEKIFIHFDYYDLTLKDYIFSFAKPNKVHTSLSLSLHFFAALRLAISKHCVYSFTFKRITTELKDYSVVVAAVFVQF